MTTPVISIDSCVRCPFGYDLDSFDCFAECYIEDDNYGAREFTEEELWWDGTDRGTMRLPREQPEWCPLNKSSYLLKAV